MLFISSSLQPFDSPHLICQYSDNSKIDVVLSHFSLNSQRILNGKYWNCLNIDIFKSKLFLVGTLHSCFWNNTEKIVCFKETGKAYYKLIIIIVIATTCRCKIQILISGYNVLTKHSWQRDNCSFGAAVFKNIQAIKFHRINKAVPICL